ncbi:MAG: hypothetical protein AABY64_12255, partial [Bdellovibrionota bacterium]
SLIKSVTLKTLHFEVEEGPVIAAELRKVPLTKKPPQAKLAIVKLLKSLMIRLKSRTKNFWIFFGLM